MDPDRSDEEDTRLNRPPPNRPEHRIIGGMRSGRVGVTAETPIERPARISSVLDPTSGSEVNELVDRRARGDRISLPSAVSSVDSSLEQDVRNAVEALWRNGAHDDASSGLTSSVADPGGSAAVLVENPGVVHASVLLPRRGKGGAGNRVESRGNGRRRDDEGSARGRGGRGSRIFERSDGRGRGKLPPSISLYPYSCGSDEASGNGYLGHGRGNYQYKADRQPIHQNNHHFGRGVGMRGRGTEHSPLSGGRPKQHSVPTMSRVFVNRGFMLSGVSDNSPLSAEAAEYKFGHCPRTYEPFCGDVPSYSIAPHPPVVEPEIRWTQPVPHEDPFVDGVPFQPPVSVPTRGSEVSESGVDSTAKSYEYYQHPDLTKALYRMNRELQLTYLAPRNGVVADAKDARFTELNPSLHVRCKACEREVSRQFLPFHRLLLCKKAVEGFPNLHDLPFVFLMSETVIKICRHRSHAAWLEREKADIILRERIEPLHPGDRVCDGCKRYLGRTSSLTDAHELLGCVKPREPREITPSELMSLTLKDLLDLGIMVPSAVENENKKGGKRGDSNSRRGGRGSNNGGRSFRGGYHPGGKGPQGQQRSRGGDDRGGQKGGAGGRPVRGAEASEDGGQSHVKAEAPEGVVETSSKESDLAKRRKSFAEVLSCPVAQPVATVSPPPEKEVTVITSGSVDMLRDGKLLVLRKRRPRNVSGNEHGCDEGGSVNRPPGL